VHSGHTTLYNSCGDELRAIKRYIATREDNLPWLFVSERQANSRAKPSTTSCVWPARRGSLEGSGPICSGTPTATTSDKGNDLRTMQDYLGHPDPKHAARYTRVAERRFEGLSIAVACVGAY